MSERCKGEVKLKMRPGWLSVLRSPDANRCWNRTAHPSGYCHVHRAQADDDDAGAA